MRKREQQEAMEEENKKIMEFADMWQQREDTRMAKVHEREERKRTIQSMVFKGGFKGLLFLPGLGLWP